MSSPLERTVRANRLYDAYGMLLTERQQQVIVLYYIQDLSLAEIAHRLEVTRQAVHDALVRGVGAMEDFENELELVDRMKDVDGQVKRGLSLIDELSHCLKELSQCTGDTPTSPETSLLRRSRYRLDELSDIIHQIKRISSIAAVQEKGGKNSV